MHHPYPSPYWGILDEVFSTGLVSLCHRDGNVTIKQDLTTGSLTSSTIKAPGAMKIESTAITTTGSLTTAGDLIAKSLTTSGDITGKTGIIGANILAYNNIQFNGSLLFNQINSRDYTPIVITFDGKHNVSYDMGVILTIPHKTLAILTFNNDSAKSKHTMLHNRLDSLGFKSTKSNPYIRYINDYREWRSLTLSVPPSKQVKFFGWSGESITYGPGYYEVTLEFGPHMIWAGWDECAGHFTDSLNHPMCLIIVWLNIFTGAVTCRRLCANRLT